MVSVLQTKELPTWAAKCVFLQYFKLLELLNWHTDVPSLCHFLCLKWLIPTVGKGRTGLGKSSFHFQISYPEMSSFPEAFPPVLWVDHASHRGRGGGRTRELASCKMSDLNGSKAWSIYIFSSFFHQTRILPDILFHNWLFVHLTVYHRHPSKSLHIVLPHSFFFSLIFYINRFTIYSAYK